VKARQAQTAALITNQVFIDDSLRRIFKDYLGQADLESIDEQDLPQLATTIYQLNYSGAAGKFSVLVRNSSGLLSVMSFAQVALLTPVKNFFTTLPSVAWSTIQECMTANRAIFDFLHTRVNPNETDTISVSVGSNQSTDKLRFCNSYLVDRNFSTICASVGLATRLAHVEYFKVGMVPLKPSTDLYTESEYMDIINDPIFLLLDQTARRNYPSLLRGAPLGKIEYKVVRAGRAYRLTYLGEHNNVQVGYTPQ